MVTISINGGEIMAKGVWIAIGIILILVVSIGYYVVSTKETIQSLEMNIIEIKQPAHIGRESANMEIVLEIYNPSNTTATIDRLDYNLYGNNIYLGNGEFTNGIKIPPRVTKTMNIPFTVEYATAGETIWSAIQKGTMSWKMTGTAYIHTPVRDIEVPFEQSLS